MIDRKHIESFLTINGLPADAPDEEIRSLLISARWHENDVETALVVLREDPQKHHQHIDSVHKVFHSDQRIKPETLNALLGIDIELNQVSQEHHKEMTRAYRLQMLSMILFSLFLGATALMFAMWYLKVGVFHSQW